MADNASALRGGKLKSIFHDENAVHVTVGGTTATFSSTTQEGHCLLTVDVGPEAEPSGYEMMDDAEGRKIVRVHRSGEEISLHFDDGEVFHILAVTNEDGCRVATRQEREHGRGGRSLLDKFLGVLHGRVPK